jgi:hypothetical protein
MARAIVSARHNARPGLRSKLLSSSVSHHRRDPADVSGSRLHGRMA